MTGKVVHFEIPVDDVKRAKAFYNKAFGWQMAPVPEMEYTMVGTTPSDKNGRPKEPGQLDRARQIEENLKRLRQLT